MSEKDALQLRRAFQYCNSINRHSSEDGGGRRCRDDSSSSASFTIRIGASNVAAATGYHPYKNLVELVFQLVYQGRIGQLLLQHDANLLDLELVSEQEQLLELAQKVSAGTRRALEDALQVKQGTKTITDIDHAQTVKQQVQNEIQKAVTSSSVNLTSSERALLVEGTRTAVDTGFGIHHEEDGLDLYQQQCGWNVYERNAAIRIWSFTKGENIDESDDPKTLPSRQRPSLDPWKSVRPIGPARVLYDCTITDRTHHNDDSKRKDISSTERYEEQLKPDELPESETYPCNSSTGNSSNNNIDTDTHTKVDDTAQDTNVGIVDLTACDENDATRHDTTNKQLHDIKSDMKNDTRKHESIPTDDEATEKSAAAAEEEPTAADANGTKTASSCAETSNTSPVLFSILGSVDGIRDELVAPNCGGGSCNNDDSNINDNDSNEMDEYGMDEYDIRRVIVECKHRMNRIHEIPPIYEQIQAVVYCHMYETTECDIVQVLRKQKQQQEKQPQRYNRKQRHDRKPQQQHGHGGNDNGGGRTSKKRSGDESADAEQSHGSTTSRKDATSSRNGTSYKRRRKETSPTKVPPPTPRKSVLDMMVQATTSPKEDSKVKGSGVNAPAATKDRLQSPKRKSVLEMLQSSSPPPSSSKQVKRELERNHNGDAVVVSKVTESAAKSEGDNDKNDSERSKRGLLASSVVKPASRKEFCTAIPGDSEKTSSSRVAFQDSNEVDRDKDDVKCGTNSGIADDDKPSDDSASKREGRREEDDNQRLSSVGRDTKPNENANNIVLSSTEVVTSDLVNTVTHPMGDGMIHEECIAPLIAATADGKRVSTSSSRSKTNVDDTQTISAIIVQEKENKSNQIVSDGTDNGITTVDVSNNHRITVSAETVEDGTTSSSKEDTSHREAKQNDLHKPEAEEETNKTSSSALRRETIISVNRISLDDPIQQHRHHWDTMILPRLRSFVEAVYRIRSDDSKRYRLLVSSSDTTGNFSNDGWDLLHEECPWLKTCDTAYQRLKR